MSDIKTNFGPIIIIYEDPDYLIVNKPAGLITHQAHEEPEESLASILSIHYPEIKKVGDDPKRPGIVHRLDKEVSGLLIIARRQESFDYFKKQFKKRLIEKEYGAIIYGSPSKEEARINFPIIRAKSGHKMAAIPMPRQKNQAKISNRERGNEKARLNSKDAITDFKVEKKWPHISLLSVKILSGRTHQIRVHLAAYGHPLLGDDLYGTSKTIKRNKTLELKRIFLFAKKLSFKDLNGNKKEFKLAPPKEMADFLKKQK